MTFGDRCVRQNRTGVSIKTHDFDFVISDACHFPELAEAGAGEVVPLEAGAVAAALARVLDDPGRARRMGAAGRRLVEERFTWGAAAARLLEFYRRHINVPG